MLKRLAVILCFLKVFFYSSAYAEIPDKPYYASIAYGIASVYTGAKYHKSGNLIAEQNFKQRVSKPSATQFTGGFRFSESWAIETQYMISGILNAPFFIGNDEIFDLATLSAQSYGFYGMYQKGKDVFFRARLGVGQTFVNLSGGGADVNYNGFGLTYGFSFGHTLGELGGIEFSYMRYANAKAANNGCIAFNDSANQTCSKVAGANRFLKLNENIRNSIVTVGYYFEF